MWLARILGAIATSSACSDNQQSKSNRDLNKTCHQEPPRPLAGPFIDTGEADRDR
jgi:hypothetical protein